MASTRHQLVDLIDHQALAPEDVPRAVSAAGLYPAGPAWRRFLDRLLLWLASVSLATSVVFFVAYNWAEWGRLVRFGLVEGALLLAIAAYLRFGRHPVAAQASLLAATLILGALLALVGQVYQTGADPWQLFAGWAVLMLPWALLGRAPVLWVVWVALLNLASVLYVQTFSLFGWVFFGDLSLYWLLFVFNTLMLVIWEVSALRWRWLAADWARRLVAIASGTAITWLACLSILMGRGNEIAALMAYGLWLAGLYAAYRRWRLDLFMLAGGCLTMTVVVTVLLARHMLDSNEVGGFALIALVILGLGAGSAQWLTRLNREASV